MLWKLADNVKYEDDCEVSLGTIRVTHRTVKIEKVQSMKLLLIFQIKVYFRVLVANQSSADKKANNIFSGP